MRQRRIDALPSVVPADVFAEALELRAAGLSVHGISVVMARYHGQWWSEDTWRHWLPRRTRRAPNRHTGMSSTTGKAPETHSKAPLAPATDDRDRRGGLACRKP